MTRVHDAGFSLVEMIVATAILLATMGIFFHLAARGQRLARSQPDAADVHQRLRVAANMIKRDVLNAGSGPMHGVHGGSLATYLPPIVPARLGARSADPENSWFADRISLLYSPAGGWHASLMMEMASRDEPVPIDAIAAGCPGAGLCGFVEGTRAAIVDVSALGAGYDVFTVTGILGGLHHGSPNPPFSRPYAAPSSIVVPVVHRVYYLDRPNRRLMSYDGYQTDVPLVDNVVALEFSYFGDPRAGSVARPADDEENCVFAAGSPPVPRLSDSTGFALVPLGADEMTDGPLCGVAPYRFDGDLLRIRRVRVRIRVQASGEYLRGRGTAFTNAGTSSNGDSYVPDFEVTFDVSPRNMDPRR